MIRKNGPKHWSGVHLTYETDVEDLIDIDNIGPNQQLLTGFDLFKNAAKTIDKLAQEASQAGKRLRAIGAGWALSDINITDGWLLNTKLLKACYDIAGKYFHESFPLEKRPYIVLAQCGLHISELNHYLEHTALSGFRRCLFAAGIGNGQTIAGSVSGNTHGSQINYGAMPDFVVGIHLVTGDGQSKWIERASKPIANDEFVERLGAELIRDDDVFNSAVVSFGTFGVVAALAIETSPIFHVEFPAVNDISFADLKSKLDNFDTNSPENLWHYEFVFNPYSRMAMEAVGQRIPFEPNNPTPKPPWIVRTDEDFILGADFAPGANTPGLLASIPFISARLKARFQFDQYRKLAILNNVRGSPGQLYTASIYYLEGYAEAAIGVSILDASRMLEISSDVVKEMKLPAISQVRLVHPSNATLGFTKHGPKTAVFEFGLINDPSFPEFERRIDTALGDAGIKYTLHWSKNSGIDSAKVQQMYGPERINVWKQARDRVFSGNAELKAVFENDALVRGGLSG